MGVLFLLIYLTKTQPQPANTTKARSTAIVFANAGEEYVVTDVTPKGPEVLVSLESRHHERHVLRIVQEFGETGYPEPAISLERGYILQVQDTYLTANERDSPFAVFMDRPYMISPSRQPINRGVVIRPVPALDDE
jgi:hypothetical protein